jgi:Glyoxalase-like domain
MSAIGPRVRLRQAVILAEDLEATSHALRRALALGEPFRDPGVGEFGLANAVFAIGDCFLEVISPHEPGTAAGRWLERHGGDGGYMAIFDLEDLEGARERAAGLGVRVVWRIDLPDISGTHLHPADVGGAILSLDRSNPYGSWRWGGPRWTGLIAPPAPGALEGISVAVEDPARVADRWGAVLGVEVDRGRLPLDGGAVSFEAAGDDGQEGIVEIALELPRELPGGGETVEVGGVRLRRVETRSSW